MERKKLTTEEEDALCTPPENDLINNLPNDCLLHVFSYLSVEDRLRVHEVCKRWRDFGPDVWRNVRSFNLLNLEKLKTQHSRIVSLCGRFLLDLTMVIFEKSDVPRVAAEHCQALTKIRVIFESWDDADEQWQKLSRLFIKNPRIRSAKLENVETEFATNFESLYELSEELDELELWGFKSSSGGQPIVWYAPCDATLARFTKLRRLVLAGFKIYGSDLRAIEHMKELKHLEIRESHDGSFDIDRISQLTKLEHLYLHRLKNTSDWWFRELVRNNSNLRHLEIPVNYVSADSMRELSKLPLLENLDLRWLYQGFFEDENFGHFQSLRKFQCNIIQDPGAILLLKTSPCLEFMNLSADTYVTPRVLEVAHQVTSRRIDVPLHIVIEDNVANRWKKPKHISPLLQIEKSRAYLKRTDPLCLAECSSTSYDSSDSE